MKKFMEWLGAKLIALLTLALFAALIGVIASVVAKAFMIGWTLLS